MFRSLRFWRERTEIIDDLHRGLFTVSETMKRLEAHMLPGGSERNHVFSCRNKFLPCHCPFSFDRTELVSLEA